MMSDGPSGDTSDKGTLRITEFFTELFCDRFWLLGMVVLAIVGLTTLCFLEADTYSRLASWWCKRGVIVAMLVAGVPISQCIVLTARHGAAHLSELEAFGGGEKNRWPQRLLGFAEGTAFTVAFAATAEPGGVITGAAAWIAVKQFGDWPRWSRRESSEHRVRGDNDEPRRRLYVFLLANLVQVGCAAVLGRSIRWVVWQV